MFLTIPSYSTSHFSFASNRFIAEASEIPNFKHHRLSDEATAMGIALRSHKSARVVRFVLYYTETNGEDVIAWHYAILGADRESNPSLENVTVVIIND